MCAAATASEGIEVRAAPAEKRLLQLAAAASYKTVSQFLLDAGIRAAKDALVNPYVFRLDPVRSETFQTILDRPVRCKPRLAKLLAQKSVTE